MVKSHDMVEINHDQASQAVARTANAVLTTQRGKSDDEIVQDILRSNQGALFSDLMQGRAMTNCDQKTAIMTLLWLITRTTQDPDQIDRIFRRGNQVPPWWDEAAKKNGQVSSWTNAQYYIAKTLATREIFMPTVMGLRYLTCYNPDENPRYPMDDVGISCLFADLLMKCLRYCTERKCWYYFDGRVWVKSNGAAMENAKLFSDIVEKYGVAVSDINTRAFPIGETKKEKEAIDPYLKHVKRAKARKMRETILKDAESSYGIATAASEFDTRPNLLCCKNVTLDLENLTPHPHNPDDMITMMADVEYNPQAQSSLWSRHIETVMDGDQEKAIYFQKAIGYSLAGDNKLCCLFILYGPKSRNGKSATMDTINKMMGAYGASANPETFAAKQSANGSAHSDDLARLVGKRFVSIPESESTMTLSSSLVKRVTGDGEITTRAIYEAQFTYTPQFTLFFHTNHLPRVNDMSVFDSGRVKVIPFTHYFPPADRNPNMVAELTTPENLSGILNWALEGLRMLKAEGLTSPRSVLEATEDYHTESDRVGNFLSECILMTTGCFAPTREVFERYKIWAAASGLYPGREQDFKRAMEQRGIAVSRPRIDGKQVTAYVGWRLA